MKWSFISSLLLLHLTLQCISCAENPTFAREDRFMDFFRKDEVTIAVTDSGLGGLSVLADAVERSRKWKSFRKVDFVYFNSLFSDEGGYNSLRSDREKTILFDSALKSLDNRYDPDLILIACNTLSTIYDGTSFASQTRIPVKGMIDAGVDAAADALKAHPGSKIIMFGTQTTVDQDAHRARLLRMGFLPERMVYQPCPELVEYIEADNKGEETGMLIFAYVDEALQKTGIRTDPLIVSLNCTHYGYSLDLWREAFGSLGVEPVAFLNPNPMINDFLYRPQHQGRFKNTDISVRVVSMVEIEKKKRESIGTFLQPISPQTARALRDYEKDPDLFEWKRFLKKRS